MPSYKSASSKTTAAKAFVAETPVTKTIKPETKPERTTPAKSNTQAHIAKVRPVVVTTTRQGSVIRYPELMISHTDSGVVISGVANWSYIDPLNVSGNGNPQTFAVVSGIKEPGHHRQKPSARQI